MSDREEAFRDGRELLDFALEANQVGTFFHDHTRQSFVLSPQALVVLGAVGANELDMQSFVALMHPDDRGVLLDRMATAHASPRASREYQLDFRVGGAEDRRWVRLRARVDEAGNGTRREYGALRDVTREHELAEALAVAQRRHDVGRLTGVIAHDFNNFLTSMLAEASLANMHPHVPGEVRQSLCAIEAAVERACVLTRQLLSYSRGRGGSPRSMRLDHLLDEALRFLCRVLPETIELRVHGQEVDWPVRLDSAQFQQVLLTLVTNACEAGTKDTRIVLSICRVAGHTVPHLGLDDGDYVVFAVEADGTASSPLARGGSRKALTEYAAGLGLGDCAVIAEELGGALALASELGTTATARLYIPILSAATWHELSRTSSMPISPDARRRVLVVEDDPVLRDLIARCLTAFDFDTESVADADALLAAVGASPFDLVLSDVVLRGTPMAEVRARLKSTHPGLSVLFMSGYPAPDHTPDSAHLLQDGDGFIQKPFTVAAVVQKIRQLLVPIDSRPTR